MSQEKKSGSILCPSCRKLISANAPVCIHCGRKNPGLWGISTHMSRFQIDATAAITAVCIGLYVIALLIDLRAVLQMRGLFDLLSPSSRALLRLGMTGFGIVRFGYWWTVITAIYLHGSLLHILFNVLWIRQLAPLVEELYGVSRFFIIFTLAGIVGFVASNAMGIPATVGASGSIFGLLGAVIYYGHHRGGVWGREILRRVGSWALILFLFGFMMSNVNNLAHAGGFVGGYLSAWLLGYREKVAVQPWHRFFAWSLLALTVYAFIRVVFSG
ncbi:rhomboid family intramembrane serine protease [candidate division KSB1 bacterium]|nr:rhomboid family intramembrane serine protease [candidate division KSB1 bacterium]